MAGFFAVVAILAAVLASFAGIGTARLVSIQAGFVFSAILTSLGILVVGFFRGALLGSIVLLMGLIGFALFAALTEISYRVPKNAIDGKPLSESSEALKAEWARSKTDRATLPPDQPESTS